MADVSKTASNLKDISNTVVSAVRTHQERLAERVAARLFGGAPSDEYSVEEFVVAFADYLEGSTEAFAKAAASVLTEVTEDRAASAAEDLAVEAMRDEIIAQRALIDGTYGPGTAARFGFAGETPATPAELVEAGRAVEDKLRSQDFPPVRPGRVALDKTELADMLADLREELAEAARANIDEVRQTEGSRSDRDRGREEWDLDYKGVANAIVGLFFIAREPDLAERVRPTARRRQGKPEQEDLEDTPVDTDIDEDAADDVNIDEDAADDVDEPVEA